MKIYLAFLLLVILSNLSYADDFAETLKLAEQGDADAQDSIGFMYAAGLWVPENDKTAVMWYAKAAEQGHAEAQSNLGWMYDNGEGVPEDDKTAVMWYTKAAEQGHARAQTVLGTMYANGEGVPENDVKAYVWVSMAKANGDEVAKVIIDVFKTEMTKEQIAKAQKLAAKCYASDYKDCN